MYRVIEKLFWVTAALGAAAATFATFFNEIPLLLEMVISFKLELVAAISFCFLLALIRRRILFSAIFLLLLALQISEIYSSFKPNDLSRVHNEYVHQGAKLKALMINLHYGNENIAAFRELVDWEKPDLIFALEIIGPWMGVMDSLEGQYKSYVPERAFEGLQVRLLSKLPLTEAMMLPLSDPLRPVLSARLSLDGHDLRILAVHLSAPQLPERFELRNKQLVKLAEMINAEKMPTLILGDLNVTRWSPYFRRFVQNAELVDSRLGRGFLHSWRPFGDSIPIFRAPIDQVLSTPDLRVTDVWLGSDVGSDHLPMIAEFSQRYATDQNFYQKLRTPGSQTSAAAQ